MITSPRARNNRILPLSSHRPIIRPVARRVHIPTIRPGRIDLPPDQAHHLRHVLRLKQGDTIEIFDDAGSTATATLHYPSPDQTQAQVDQIQPPDLTTPARILTIASAVPKAARADWMIEKLTELGVDRFIPLQTARSVVHPQGKSKHDRWQRIAREASKQSQRKGIMPIDPLTPLTQALGAAASAASDAWHLSPTSEAIPIMKLLKSAPPQNLTLFIGPEGGWTREELDHFQRAQARTIRLTTTILRTETAAIAAAALTAPWLHPTS
jgi:16S rRNA (uracil1498-N3)-methyltransferase